MRSKIAEIGCSNTLRTQNETANAKTNPATSINMKCNVINTYPLYCTLVLNVQVGLEIARRSAILPLKTEVVMRFLPKIQNEIVSILRSVSNGLILSKVY